MARRHRFPLWLFAILLACLCACAGAIDQTITFSQDEAWETQVTLEFPGEIAPLLGSEVDNQLSTLQQRVETDGGRMEWERSQGDNGRLTYTIDASGRGYDVLRSVSFSDMNVVAAEQNGRRQLTFTATPLLDAASHTLTVVGGEILSSNGTVTGGDTVTWVDSRQVMQAVLTERQGVSSSLPLLPLLGGLALIILGGLLAWYLLRRRGRAVPAWDPGPAPSAVFSPPPPTAPPPPDMTSHKAAIASSEAKGARFCVNCGASLRPGARFCATCGHEQPE